MLLAVPCVMLLIYLFTQLTLIACPIEWDKVTVGLTEPEVTGILGDPVAICSTGDESEDQAHCHLDGYAKPPNGFIGASTTLVYTKCDKVFYIFFKDNGAVAAKWWGGS